LEAHFEVLLANPQHLPKQVPGRKTDVKDAAWLAELLQYGLIRASVIPDRQQRELRDLVRYRLTLVDERSRVINRLQKVLEDANIKLSAVATDLQGVSAQAMPAALLAGEVNPTVLAELARGRLRSKRAQLEQAFIGRMRAHHRFMLGELLEQLEFVDEKIGKVASRIAEMLAQMPEFEHAVAELDAIPGVERQAAVAIVAEIGVDMSRFPSDRHITAWAGVAPGNNETGGKSREAPARKGNKYLRRVLIQCGHGAGRTKRCYSGSMYGRLAARRGKQRAAVATGRTILQIVYHMLNRGTSYADWARTTLSCWTRSAPPSGIFGNCNSWATTSK
jgi:transposase